jgi:RNA polymerase sigma factor (sigma-70 family)
LAASFFEGFSRKDTSLLRERKGERTLRIPKTDEEIVAAVLRGKINHFSLLIEKYENLVFSIALGYTKNEQDAKDLSSETFFAAYKSLSSYRGNGFRGWVCKITLNRCNDWARKKKREKLVFPLDEREDIKAPDDDLPEEQVLKEESFENVKRLIAALPPPYGPVAEECLLEGKTAGEVAKSQNENVKTVETRLRRAKEKLRQALKEEK